MDLTKMQLLAWKTTFGKMNVFDDLPMSILILSWHCRELFK